MRFRFVLLALPIAFATVAFAACNGESEGMPCDHSANDCQDPLTCTNQIPGQGWRCCPQDLTQATTSECSRPTSATDANPAPPDSSTGDDSAPEAASDGPSVDGGPSAGEAGDAPSGIDGAGNADGAGDGAPPSDGAAG
jgi:hypothetical protein